MSKNVLPKSLRLKIIELFGEGLSTLEVHDLVYEDSLQFVNSEKQLSKCLVRLKVEAGKLSQDPAAPIIDSEPLPGQKSFDNTIFHNIIKNLTEVTPNKEFEKATMPIAAHILKKYEGFNNLVYANYEKNFHNPPFDFFGFKNGKPFIVEFKGSLENFNSPGETQKRRMQELLARIDNLNVSLLQVKLKKGLYRILYNGELNYLFDGQEIPLEPVITWIQDQISNGQ
jgi:hypothetical protein